MFGRAKLTHLKRLILLAFWDVYWNGSAMRTLAIWAFGGVPAYITMNDCRYPLSSPKKLASVGSWGWFDCLSDFCVNFEDRATIRRVSENSSGEN